VPSRCKKGIEDFSASVSGAGDYKTVTGAVGVADEAINNRVVNVPGVGRSIPDSLIRGVAEIKGGLEIDSSLQLRVHVAHTNSQKLPFNLVVAPTTWWISEDVKEAVRKSGGTILRFYPATGKFGPFP
jgi:hypothetical protein